LLRGNREYRIVDNLPLIPFPPFYPLSFSFLAPHSSPPNHPISAFFFTSPSSSHLVLSFSTPVFLLSQPLLYTLVLISPFPLPLPPPSSFILLVPLRLFTFPLPSSSYIFPSSSC
jgi:hypothetical protein